MNSTSIIINKTHLQNIFGASSANYDKYPEIWLKNIEDFYHH
jgi:hypothetical protein